MESERTMGIYSSDIVYSVRVSRKRERRRSEAGRSLDKGIERSFASNIAQFRRNRSEQRTLRSLADRRRTSIRTESSRDVRAKSVRLRGRENCRIPKTVG